MKGGKMDMRLHSEGCNILIITNTFSENQILDFSLYHTILHVRSRKKTSQELYYENFRRSIPHFQAILGIWV